MSLSYNQYPQFPADAKIINKKTTGNKLLYQVVSKSSKNWVDYQKLMDLLPQIIEYEKSLNPIIKARGQAKDNVVQILKESSQQTISRFNKTQPIVHNPGNLQIKYIEYLDMLGKDSRTNEKIFLFKAYLSNGTCEYLTNKQIKAIDMSLLVKFYESQIH